MKRYLIFISFLICALVLYSCEISNLKENKTAESGYDGYTLAKVDLFACCGNSDVFIDINSFDFKKDTSWLVLPGFPGQNDYFDQRQDSIISHFYVSFKDSGSITFVKRLMSFNDSSKSLTSLKTEEFNVRAAILIEFTNDSDTVFISKNNLVLFKGELVPFSYVSELLQLGLPSEMQWW